MTSQLMTKLIEGIGSVVDTDEVGHDCYQLFSGVFDFIPAVVISGVSILPVFIQLVLIPKPTPTGTVVLISTTNIDSNYYLMGRFVHLSS